MTTPDDLSDQLNTCTFCGEDLAAFTEDLDRYSTHKAVVTISPAALCPQCQSIKFWMSHNEMAILKDALTEIRTRRGSLNVAVIISRLKESVEQEQGDEYVQ
jgi:hypothetical protein